MSVTQGDFPSLATILTMAGRVWQVELVGDYEYDMLTVDVHLASGDQKIGPFQFGGEGFVDREELPFAADIVQQLEAVIYQLMAKHWPLDF